MAVRASATVPHPEQEANKFILLPSDVGGAGGIHDRPLMVRRDADVARGGMGGRKRRRSLLSDPLHKESEFALLGRGVAIHRVVQDIVARRLVSVCGEGGVGKSAVAMAAARFISARRQTTGVFPDGIHYIHCARVTDSSVSGGEQHLQSEIDAVLNSIRQRMGGSAAGGGSGMDGGRGGSGGGGAGGGGGDDQCFVFLVILDDLPDEGAAVLGRLLRRRAGPSSARASTHGAQERGQGAARVGARVGAGVAGSATRSARARAAGGGPGELGAEGASRAAMLCAQVLSFEKSVPGAPCFTGCAPRAAPPLPTHSRPRPPPPVTPPEASCFFVRS